jgi:hypothetical protein
VLDKVFSTCKLKPVSASLIWCRSACLHIMLTRESKVPARFPTWQSKD